MTTAVSGESVASCGGGLGEALPVLERAFFFRSPTYVWATPQKFAGQITEAQDCWEPEDAMDNALAAPLTKLEQETGPKMAEDEGEQPGQ